MLALVITIIAAVYLFGPDLLARFVLGFVVPRRNIQQSRSEEIARAVLIALVPLAIVASWVTIRDVVHWAGSLPDIETFFAGLYSEKFFQDNPDAFYRSLGVILRLNWAIIWRLYLLLLVFSLFFNLVILRYGQLRHSKFMKAHPTMRRVLATIVLPRVSEWHVLLTSFALPAPNTPISADILTKTGTLYRGNLQDPLLAPDGSLAGLLLSDPERFRKSDYAEALKADPTASTSDYWREIPSKTFLITVGDIANINLRHFDLTDDAELLKQVSQLLEKFTNVSLSGKPSSRPTPSPGRTESGK